MVAAANPTTVLEAVRPHIHRLMLEAAVGAGLPSALFEGLGLDEAHLPQLDEPGYRQLGSNQGSITGLNRTHVNDQALQYYHTDPSARHLVKLYNAYVFGRGVSAKAADPEIDAFLQQFWDDPRNRASFTRASAQHRRAKELQLNGELFLALYVSTLTGRVTVRAVPPNEILKIHYIEGDNEMPAMYERRHIGRDNKEYKQNIPDYRIHPLTSGVSRLRDVPNTEVYMMHVLSEDLDGRGISLLATAIPWIKALKGFMEDRATLTLALSTFAYLVEIKGNQAALNQMGAQLASRYDTTLRDGVGDGRERRQGANMFLHNEAVNLRQNKVDSGASNAYMDMRMLRQQVGISRGLFEHYMGDSGNANLASATAMELPMLKMFEFEQEFWKDVYTEVLDFAVAQGIRFKSIRGKGSVEADLAGRRPLWFIEPVRNVDLAVNVQMPPIVQRDVQTHAGALTSILATQNSTGKALIPPDQAALTAMQLLGASNPSELVTMMGKTGFSLDSDPDEPDAADIPNTADNATGDTQEEAVSETNIGKALPKKEAEKVERVTRQEMDEEAEAWKKLPSLDDLLEELGVDPEDVE